jgi:acyl-CoA synthetase (AMP-forming)/AMP-acid ligase II
MSFSGANFGVVLKALAGAIPPDRPALVHGTRVVSWGELDAITDRIAAGLTARGLKPGDIAGQMLRNTPDYLLAYFGCIKAGVVPVNVNYHYRQRELSDIFTRFGLKALFTESDFAGTARDAMPDGAVTVDVGSDDWAALCASDLPGAFAVHEDAQALFLTATGGTASEGWLGPYRFARFGKAFVEPQARGRSPAGRANNGEGWEFAAHVWALH